SSRRRHTRWPRDWSSDVCSSDLFLEAGVSHFAGRIPLILKLNNHDVLHEDKDPLPAVTGSVRDALRLGCSAVGFTIYPGSVHCRSEERRVGKECRSGWGRDSETK